MLRVFREKDFYYPFTIWIIVSLWYLVFVYNFFEVAQRKAQDFFSAHAFYLFSRRPPEAEKIVIVAIDEFSRRKLNLKWPWPRTVTAQLIRNIASFSPKVIGLDIIFAGKSTESEDQELVSALKSHPRIILGYRLAGRTAELPLSEFTAAAQAVGFVDRPLEISKVPNSGTVIDKVIRHIRTFHIDQTGARFSLDVEVLASFLDVLRQEIKLDLQRGVALENKLFIPSPRGITPLNYLVSYPEFTTVPAYLALEKRVDPAIFKDKMVLVGATDPLIHDEHMTPLGILSGIVILGNSLAMLLSKRFIVELTGWQTVFIIYLLGILLLLVNKKAGFGLSTFFTFLILLAAFVVSLYLRSAGVQFDYFSVFFLSFTAYAVSNTYKYSYLTYMRNRLRTLAIRDPLSGFYSFRYFLLKLDEELKDRSKSLAFLGLIVSNYRRLALDLNFEELKSFFKMLSEYTESSMEKNFKKLDLSRLSQDIICVAVWNEEKEPVERVFKGLLERLKEIEFKFEERTARATVQAILLYKPKGKMTSSREIVYNMEYLLRSLREEPQKLFISVDLEEKLWERRREALKEDILDFLSTDMEERNKELERTLKELLTSKKELEETYFEVIRSLIKALEEKDTFTQGHSERVANYSQRIALEVGLSQDESELIYKASLLHDIGKIGLPDYLLHKKGKLTREEIELIHRHELISVEILKPLKVFKDLLPIILHHHESIDGTGYPYGLSGDMVPRGAQILAIADTFDAITTGRGYKKAKHIDVALAELETYKGTKFNPVYIDALKKIVKI